MLLNFVTAKNLVDPELNDGAPWDFVPDATDLDALRKTPKEKRRQLFLKPDMTWSVYSAVRGVAPNRRVGGDNPASGLRGLVADYDLKSSVPTILGYLNQIPKSFLPNFIEVSLGMKARLVWVFEKEILTPDSAFCSELVSTMFKKMGVPTLLPGYDACSEKPTTVWTNGGEWYGVQNEPMPWDLVFGMAVDVSKRSDLGRSEIPLEIIAAEVQKRWPNRWQGEFALNNLGVRFWDELADNTTGCQVKPDGLLAFTGTKSFVKWAELFGIDWVNEQRSLNLGKAAGEVYFDGRKYWECFAGRWKDKAREDVILTLKNNGISAKAGKGQTISDAERVLAHIQAANRVDGAAPLVNSRPGIVEYDGNRILNVSTLKPYEPAAKTEVTPEQDFPWLWEFLNGLFDSMEKGSLDHFLAWLKRFYKAQYEYRADLGQAIFLCGPKNNGKSLLCLKIVKPLIGDRIANPYDYFTGQTAFTDDLFTTPLLAMNDETPPEREDIKQKFLARLKAFVVNPSHTYHPKFCPRFNINWTGRVFVTLNNDANSVGVLPEVNSNTNDKISFFGSRPYAGQWGDREEVEGTIAKELPFFARWLLSVYQPPKSVLAGGRMGVASFFDKRVLEMSQQQIFAYSFKELLGQWTKTLTYWENDGKETWTGNPTSLQDAIKNSDLDVREWSVNKIHRSLLTLSRLEGSGVEVVEGGDREFRITKSKLIKQNDNKN